MLSSMRNTAISPGVPGARLWPSASRQSYEEPQMTSIQRIGHAHVNTLSSGSPNLRPWRNRFVRSGAIALVFATMGIGLTFSHIHDAMSHAQVSAAVLASAAVSGGPGNG
jgi:hypothetical protein